MCEYCEAIYDGDTLVSPSVRSMKEQVNPFTIVPAHYSDAESDLGIPLDTAALGIYVDWDNGSDYYPINFCPMCGRDLREYTYQKPEMHRFKVDILNGDDGVVLESFKIENRDVHRVIDSALEYAHEEYGMRCCMRIVDEKGRMYVEW